MNKRQAYFLLWIPLHPRKFIWLVRGHRQHIRWQEQWRKDHPGAGENWIRDR